MEDEELVAEGRPDPPNTVLRIPTVGITRWNSTWSNMKRVYALKKPLMVYAIDHNDIDVPTPFEFERIADLVDVLGPVADVTIAMQESTSPNSPKVLSVILRMVSAGIDKPWLASTSHSGRTYPDAESTLSQ